MTTLDLGNRHSRTVVGLGSDATSKTVEIRAGALEDSQPAQHLLVCLVNLLARLHGSVSRIEIAVEGEFSVAVPQAVSSRNAFDALVEMARWANGDRIPVAAPTGAADIRIDLRSRASDDADLYAWGAGWKAWVGNTPPTFTRSTDVDGCLGPYFAAAMLAAEVFKMSRGIVKGRQATDDAYSLWDGTVGLWGELEDGPSLRSLDMPALYLIGAGAVGQGLIQILGSSELSSGYVVTIDHDRHDDEGTNLNRCFLAGIDDIGGLKVDVVERFRKHTGLDGYEFKGKLTDYLPANKPGLRADLADAERRDVFNLIVSAVDINESRQDIQGLRPSVIIGGSTDSLRAQATTYGLVDGAGCLSCLNPIGDSKMKAMAIEAELRALSTDEQRERLLGKVSDLEAALSYLSTQEPRCGQLGEAEVRNFASATSPEFSISFVSMAAAAMTAARLIASIVDQKWCSQRAATSVFQFKSFAAAETTLARRPNCQHCIGSDVATKLKPTAASVQERWLVSAKPLFSQ
ncbi:hypothetical protein ELI55_27040 (plasmid) [Rhizobium ruizarguesonis]|uniref:ThiF family adenylyltransferase n=1 Tax=Rhizobium ruizarguesonis TaxID=2081791 RepID=UPI001030254B|nr:ThiF family adenylyltransferase [Rhizobium ruizarguesonis]TAT96172.1 hypothetical protein ELI55_27040 [Rhizobium ruizarguesonis]